MRIYIYVYKDIHMYICMEVSTTGGIPKCWLVIKNPIDMDDLETISSISGFPNNYT